ncbi:MAG: DUF2752 domain-containing protein [Bacteroidia bacterium]|nr:DUF2752 domain-containing protein [Bacteroidia bacterium]MDW8015649.1 DUF2752 domain-containing protein [Bacteroidia bacterium]
MHFWRAHSLREKIVGALRLVIAIVPLGLLALPADFFDKGPSICPSVLLLQVECPGCGLTRATQHLLHLEWQTAIDYNPLVLISTPILAWLWLQNLFILFKGLLQFSKDKKILQSNNP